MFVNDNSLTAKESSKMPGCNPVIWIGTKLLVAVNV